MADSVPPKPRRRTATELIQAEQLKISQAKARIAALHARESQTARRLDTRRKIILGARVLEKVAQNPGWHKAVTHLIATLPRASDRKAFEGFTLPALKHAPERPTEARTEGGK